ncbi:hypothetical protein JTE90_020369 [Oedothorax gibbosus]|uniref:Serpin domain-containing protein n=1 Tax=Oedothorax gibbosus TaxID=931172 RepID=A0AAV6TWY0_9ARAC|nr:hypothetical protein JTE90_020369 [Oedothorax gibbosus]
MADIASPSVAVSESVNRLGISLLQALSNKNDGNVFISPFSLATALAMLHSGARGETRKEMRKVLGYEDAGIQDEKVAEAFSGLLSSLDNSSNSYVLSCANSLVAQQDFAVKDEYKGLLTESFRASLFLADFKKEPEKAVADINKWVGEKTNGEA